MHRALCLLIRLARSIAIQFLAPASGLGSRLAGRPPIEALSCRGTNELSVFRGRWSSHRHGRHVWGVSRYGWFLLNSSRLETRLDPLVPVFALDPLEVLPEMS